MCIKSNALVVVCASGDVHVNRNSCTVTTKQDVIQMQNMQNIQNGNYLRLKIKYPTYSMFIAFILGSSLRSDHSSVYVFYCAFLC